MGKFLKLVGGVPRLVDESISVTIYDENYAVEGTITTGTPVTLPASGTYDSAELEVTLNGQRLEPVFDYNYVGSVPRTQVSFTFDLIAGDSIGFRVDRTP
jgi:hypothetical protein